jgi:hypothetical protein
MARQIVAFGKQKKRIVWLRDTHKWHDLSNENIHCNECNTLNMGICKEFREVTLTGDWVLWSMFSHPFILSIIYACLFFLSLSCIRCWSFSDYGVGNGPGGGGEVGLER